MKKARQEETILCDCTPMRQPGSNPGDRTGVVIARGAASWCSMGMRFQFCKRKGFPEEGVGNGFVTLKYLTYKLVQPGSDGQMGWGSAAQPVFCLVRPQSLRHTEKKREDKQDVELKKQAVLWPHGHTVALATALFWNACPDPSLLVLCGNSTQEQGEALYTVSSHSSSSCPLRSTAKH